MILKLVLIQIATLAIIILILRHIFTRHVNTALNNLHTLYRDNLKKEEVLNEEIARTKALREKAIAQAEEEAHKILSQAKTRTEQEAEKLIQEAEEQAEAQAKQTLEKVNLQLDNEYRELVQSLRAKVADFSETAINYILSQKSKRLLQEELTEELLKELNNIPKEEMHLTDELHEVVVTCAYPLEETQKQEVRDAVSRYLEKGDLGFNFKVDEGIIGGLILNFGGRIIDGSLHNRLRQAFSKIETHLELEFKPKRAL